MTQRPAAGNGPDGLGSRRTVPGWALLLAALALASLAVVVLLYAIRETNAARPSHVQQPHATPSNDHGAMTAAALGSQKR